MDAWLSQIYGTNNGAASDDLEKTAQAMLLEKMAQAEGIDLSGLSQDELDALAAEVITEEQPAAAAPTAGAPVATKVAAETTVTVKDGQGQLQAGAPAAAQPVAAQGQVPAAAAATEAAPAEELAKEAMAKFEEADFLGRVMAHAYTQELEKIAASKTAGEVPPQFAKKDEKEHEKKEEKEQEKKASTKLASAIEKLALLRAREILTQNGINPDTGAPVQAAPAAAAAPVAQPATQTIQQAVDGRAMDMLKEAGYRFE